MSQMHDKSKYREVGLELRKNLNVHERKKANILIQNKIKKKINQANFNRIMFYLSSAYEVNTDDLIRDLLTKNFKIYVPKTLDNSLMNCIEMKSLSSLTLNKYKIREPLENIKADPNLIECIIVPMICGDILGHRIGYGKGYYDKFLANINAFKIGIAYQCQIHNQIPFENHDIKMDMIITDKSTYLINDFTCL